MKHLTLFSAIILCSVLDAHCQSSPKPKELVDLRVSFEKARSAALSPLEKKYVDALTSMKDRLTKKGDLNGALAVQAEIAKLTVSTPDTTNLRLSKFESIDEFKIWLSTTTWKSGTGELFRFPGGAKMELTRKDGSIINYSATIDKVGGVTWTYSTGAKALMTVAPSLKDATTSHSGTITRTEPK